MDLDKFNNETKHLDICSHKNKMFVTNHALDKWNSRVGPMTKSEISKYLRKMAKENKIEHYYESFYLVDDDIVVMIEETKNASKKDCLALVTVYGRRSENAALNNMRAVMKHKKKYGNMVKDLERFITVKNNL